MKVLADIYHGIAPWIGDDEYVEGIYSSLLKRSKDYDLYSDAKKYFVILSYPNDLSDSEINWIKSKRLLPRRVLMKLLSNM